MAEIALVASVIQLAGFGAAVAKNLYDAADVMIHANRQILALAKHVSQFTAVLKRMGEVLDAEKANCTKEVLRSIRSIKHSCKKTFREIKATVKSKHFRHVKWIFKKSKAMELESRLDSHQSILQCIITTLTVSKLGHMETRLKENSQHNSGLKDEITLLKTFVMESYNNTMELRRNESRADMETKPQPNDSDDGDGSAAGSSPQSDDDQETENVIYVFSSDDEPRTPDDDQETSMGVHQNASPQTDKRRDDRVEIISSTRNKTESVGIHDESNLLLHMIPYRPNIPRPIQSDRLLPAVPGRDDSKTSTSKGPTESVRHLLDKWTLSGSAPIFTILDEESSKEEEEEEEPRREEYTTIPPRYARRPSPRFGEFGDHFGASPYRENYNYSPHGGMDFPTAPPSLPDCSGHKEFWRSNHRFASTYSHIGPEILHLLRSSRGGIHYAKANHFRRVHYVDARPIYTCNLVPSYLIPPNESVALSTEIGDGLVRKEALELLGYSFSKTKQGDFLIQGNLDLREIEELVKLSYQALDRKLTEQSHKIIKERDLKAAVDNINFSMPETPLPRPAPSRYRPKSPQSPPGSPPSVPSSPPSPPFQPTPVDPGRLEGTRLDIAPREVRFTLPRAHMTSSAPNTTKKTKAPTQNDPPVEKIDDELLSLQRKRKILLAKSVWAEKARDLETAADLKYYAIPYVETQIKEKEEERNNTKGVASSTRATPTTSDTRTTEGDTKAFQTEVETKSEDSDVESGSA